MYLRFWTLYSSPVKYGFFFKPAVQLKIRKARNTQPNKFSEERDRT